MTEEAIADETGTLARWCEHVPGLVKTGARQWALSPTAAVSFPADAHTSLAGIEERSYWFKHRNDVIIAAVKQHPPNGIIFDVGGGNGFVSAGLHKAGFSCAVVEPGTIGAANAAARGLPVICAPFQDLHPANESMPAIGMFDVLEHIEDDIGVLSEIHRVLKPGGRFYVAVPSHNLLWSKEDADAGHFRRYTLHGLSKLLAKAGFVVDYKTYFFAILILPIFLIRALPARLGLQSSNRDDGQDHAPPSGVIGYAFRHSFRRELAKISAGQASGIGASCLVAAHKPVV